MAQFNNITQTKVSFSYEKDNSSSFKSERKLVYDKDFLLSLGECQKNDQKCLSQNLIGNWNCIIIEALRQGKIGNNETQDAKFNFKLNQWSSLNPVGSKVYDKKFLSSLRERPNSKQRSEYLAKDFIWKCGFMEIIKKKTCNENEVFGKVLDSGAVETNLHSSCNIDKNLVFNAGGKNVYGSDFLLPLHSSSKQKSDNLYEDIIGCDHVMSIDNVPKTKDEVHKSYGVGIERVKELHSNYLLEDLMIFLDDNDIAKDETECMEDRSEETNGFALDNKLEVSNFRLFYKKDQWSPINPGGKKNYDKHFLLCLREHPKSKEVPQCVSENWNSMKIYKQDPIRRDKIDKDKNTDADDKLFKIVESNSALSFSNENDQGSLPEDLIDFEKIDIAEGELVAFNEVLNSKRLDSKLCSSYMKNDWHHHTGARIVYDKDFLLSLREHPNGQKQPEHLPNHIIRNLNRIEGDKDSRINFQSNSVETILCSIPEKEIIEYDHFMTIQEWKRMNNKRGNGNVKLKLDCELTESKSVFSLYNETDASQEDLIDLFENSKLIEVKNENVNTVDETKLRVTYKKDQWSPLNPFGRKVYDREFLLSLRWRVTD